MELSDKAQEILESLWIQVDEQKKAPDPMLFKDNTAFQELFERKYVTIDDKNILTPKGLEEGRLCVRRHRLAERLMADVLDLKGKSIHEAGCKFEHALHKGIEDNICILLGHPKSCPHGSQIPRGECCKEARRRHESIILPLSELKNGQKGKIAYIHTEDRELLKKIMAMGALPGSSIDLVQRFPSYVFRIGHSRFAIDKPLAESIQVRLLR